jgi:hypothetical protein
MIVVVGLPVYAGLPDGRGAPAGLAVDVAMAAHGRGATVELVGKIGDDGAGDAVVVALGRAGVGHAALLRDPARPTPVLAPEPVVAETETAGAPGTDEPADDASWTGDEPADDEPADDEPGLALLPPDPAARPTLDAADIELALRYVSGASVVVVADPLADAALAAAAEGAAFSGARLVALQPAGVAAPALPGEATVLEAPVRDDGSFARLVGAFAAGLDSGIGPGRAVGPAGEAGGGGAGGG